MTALVDHVTRFFCWWGQELVSILPGSWRHQLQTPPNVLLLQVAQDGVHVIWVNSKGEHDLGILPADEEGHAAWQKQLESNKELKQASSVLVLAKDQYLDRQVDLPKLASSNLHQVMSFELDRHTPFQAEHACYDAKCLGATTNDQSIRVRLIASPLVKIKIFLEGLRRIGIAPSVISFSDSLTWPLAGEGFNLLPKSIRPPRRKKNLLVGLAISLVLMIQFLIAIMYPNWHAENKAKQLDAQIQAIEGDVQLASELRRSIDDMLVYAESMQNKTQGMPYTVELLRELTQRIPDHTWLTQLRFTGDQIEIQGFSDEAASLIQLLDQSEWFENTRFISSITSNKVSKQAFKIGMDVVQGGRDAPSTDD